MAGETEMAVSEEVYEQIEAVKREGETVDEALRRVLKIDDEEEATEGADIYGDTTNRWTVWDTLVEENRDDESLEDTFERLGES